MNRHVEATFMYQPKRKIFKLLRVREEKPTMLCYWHAITIINMKKSMNIVKLALKKIRK